MAARRNYRWRRLVSTCTDHLLYRAAWGDHVCRPFYVRGSERP